MSERVCRIAIASSAFLASTGTKPASWTTSIACIRSNGSSSTTRTAYLRGLIFYRSDNRHPTLAELTQYRWIQRQLSIVDGSVQIADLHQRQATSSAGIDRS